MLVIPVEVAKEGPARATPITALLAEDNRCKTYLEASPPSNERVEVCPPCSISSADPVQDVEHLLQRWQVDALLRSHGIRSAEGMVLTS